MMLVSATSLQESEDVSITSLIHVERGMYVYHASSDGEFCDYSKDVYRYQKTAFSLTLLNISALKLIIF